MPIHDWTRVPAGIFHDFHATWIPDIKRVLNAGALPSGCYALVEQIAGGYSPEVVALEGPPRPSPGNGSPAPAGPAEGLVMLATAPPKVRFTATADEDRYAAKAKALVIRHISDDNVVAVIEVVSPGNKSSRHAIRSLVEKSVGLIRAGVHLLVIDLFPRGPRDPQGMHHAIWSEIVEDEIPTSDELPLTLASYSAGDLKRAFVEPTSVGQKLHEMPLFLEQDAYIYIPLELSYLAAFTTVPDRWRNVLQEA